VAVADFPRAEAFIELLHSRVSAQTAAHCINTAILMESFAPDVGITRDQAVTAGLLHDLCKKVKRGAYVRAAEAYGIVPTPTQLLLPKLLHGPIAAEEARRTLGVTDAQVYEAIYWHTTGRPKLGTVGLALYFADFAEEGRGFPESDEARAILRRDGFEAALRYVVREKYKHIEKKDHVDPVTEAFHAWLETAVFR
jgi:predicted HD superfamily hydrolase involved in NAD metabolism